MDGLFVCLCSRSLDAHGTCLCISYAGFLSHYTTVSWSCCGLHITQQIGNWRSHNILLGRIPDNPAMLFILVKVLVIFCVCFIRFFLFQYVYTFCLLYVITVLVILVHFSLLSKPCTYSQLSHLPYFCGTLLNFWRLTDKKLSLSWTECPNSSSAFCISTEEKKIMHICNNKRYYLYIITVFMCRSLTVISISSFSSRATNGHQPLILFCLKMLTMGMSCSLSTMSMEHCFAVFAPRGNRFRSSSIAPETKTKHTCVGMSEGH